MYVLRFDWNEEGSLLICRNNLIFMKDLARKRQEKFSEEVKDEYNSYWEDLHFLEILTGTSQRASSCHSL